MGEVEEGRPPPWPLGEPDNLVPPPESMRARAGRLVQLCARLEDLKMKANVVAASLREVTREEGATLIAELLRAAELDPAARPTRIALILALGTETLLPTEHREGIHAEAMARGDEEVARLLKPRKPYRNAHPMEFPRPPPGSPSREMTLGERRALARRPDRNSLEKLLIDPDPMVIRNLLRNPRLTEPDVVRLAAKRPTRASMLEEIFSSQRWISRPAVQEALLLNPYNRTDISMRLLRSVSRRILKQVVQMHTLDPELRAEARKLLLP